MLCVLLPASCQVSGRPADADLGQFSPGGCRLLPSTFLKQHVVWGQSLASPLTRDTPVEISLDIPCCSTTGDTQTESKTHKTTLG